MKIIYELAISDAQVGKELDAHRARLKEINAELKKTDDADTFAKLAVEAAGAKVEIAKLTEKQKELKREFAASQLPKDSLAGMRLEYAKLTDQISKLSKAERENATGKALINNAGALKNEINGIQESVGNFTGSVGNYKNSIVQAFGIFSQFGGSLGQTAQSLQSVALASEIAAAGSEKIRATWEETMQLFERGNLNLREYFSTLKSGKQTQDATASAAQNTADAVGEIGESGQEAGKGLAEAGKGGNLMTRGLSSLRGVLAGLGIGVLILAITGLINIFTKFAPVVDFVERSIAGVSAAFDTLIQRSILLGEGIGNIFSGNFDQGIQQISQSVSGLGAAMGDAASKAFDLQKQMQDLQDETSDFELANAKAEAAVKKLSVSLKDKTKSDSERLKIAADIAKIETDNLNKKTSLIDREIEIEKKKLLATGSVTQAEADAIASGNTSLARQLEDEFRIKQDQGNRLKDLLVQRTNAEGESSTLLERVQNRVNSIQEEAANKRLAAEKKSQEAAEKAAKETEAQTARITELAKAVRELDASTITNDFDRQITEIENKRRDALEKLKAQQDELNKNSKGTGADKTEADLIKEQTASTIAAYDQQIKAVRDARDAALENSREQLNSMFLELQKLSAENAEGAIENEVERINTKFALQAGAIEASISTQENALNERLASGAIGQKEYQKELANIQAEGNDEIAALERARVDEQKQLLIDLRDSKVATAKAILATELDAINKAFEAEKKAAQAKGAKEGIDPAGEIAAKEAIAIKQREAAQLSFANSVNDANKSLEESQIAGVKAVNDADAETHRDKLARIEKEKEERRKITDFAISQAQVIGKAITDIDRNRLEAQTGEALENLDTEFEKKRENAAGNAAELERIDAQYQKKKDKIEKEAARERKEIAVKEALIQGSLAFVKALPNFFLAAAAAIATAAQIAVINSQKFQQGGVIDFARRGKSGFFGGKSHSQGGTKGRFDDGTEIEVEADELFVILNKRASGQLRKLSNLNHSTGGQKFEAGGVFDFTPQLALPGDTGSSSAIVVSTQAGFTEEQVQYIAREMAAAVGAETRIAVGEGLGDANRRLEREAEMDESRRV